LFFDIDFTQKWLNIRHPTSISIRQNVAKIDFYQALPIIDKDGADEQREFRKVSHRLVLPVTGLALKLTLLTLSNNYKANHQLLKRLSKIIN
jgi:hypothetical protein